MSEQFEAHEAAAAFPMMESIELAALAADIKRHGLREPIVRIRVGRGFQILDGRNRMRACKIACVKPQFVDYDGDDPTAYVVSLNLARRHLDESQRAIVAARLATLPNHRPSKSANLPGSVTQPQAAAMTNVAERSVRSARVVLDKGSAEVIKAVEHGQLAVSAAEKLVDLPKDQQRAILKHADATDGQKIKLSHALRKHRRETLTDRVSALPAGKFRLIYADPPWSYGDDRAGLEIEGTAAAAQYPTMKTEDICDFSDEHGRHVSDLAADDAVLFMWATFPLLEDALQVIDEWGFAYKTAFVWDKQRSNIGNYHDARAELLMIGIRGSCPIEIDTRPKQVQSIARGKHSAKPEEFRQLIESLYPSSILDAEPFRAVELFRRGKAPKGWVIWGNEAEAAS